MSGSRFTPPFNWVAAYGAAWLVSDWYIDAVVGSDANDGTTALTPLRTGAELLRRLGPYAMWAQSVTIHVLANGMVDPLVVRGVLLVAGTHVDVVGTPTLLLDAGTVATYVGIDHTIPRAPQVTLTGVADFTPLQWRRLRLTTTALANSVSWVAKPDPAGAGLGVARTPRWSQINQTSVSSYYSAVNPVGGEACLVETLPFVPSLDVLIDGQETTTAGVAQWPLRVFSLQSVDCPLLSIRGRFTTEFPRAIVWGCILGTVDSSPNSTGTVNGQNAVGCFYGYSSPSSSVNRYQGMPANNLCLFGRAYTNLQTVCSVVFQASLFQGCALIGSSRIVVNTIDCQVFDVTGAAAVQASGRMALNNLSGSGNASIGMTIANQSLLTLGGTQNLQGAVSNMQLQAAPAVNLTIPQALQSDDYAQHGITPAMVAGFATVTVPWYDNVGQQVTVSHAVFGGTPGILSVQQISNTQFTITSSSALDTSTVRWQISPLGRNIFISTS